MNTDDLIRNPVAFWNIGMALRLRARGVSDVLIQRGLEIAWIIELAFLLVAVTAVATLLRRAVDGAARGPVRRMLIVATFATVGVGAAALGWWVLRHPSQDIAALLVRWDYLVFCVLTGWLLAQVASGTRIWALAALSVVFVTQYVGAPVMVVVLAGCLLGYMAERSALVRTPAARALVQGTMIVAVIAIFWLVRSRSGSIALAGWGLFQFVLFRHLSFVVEAGRGAPASLRNYLCYLFFYPSCSGAMEVYREFLDRNLGDEVRIDYRTGVGKVLAGTVFMYFGMLITMTDEVVYGSTSTLALWRNLLLLFLRATLFATGLWSVIEGGALFYGFRLRPNFSGILTASSPSMFWRAWRGTMTNWLIQYVYIPLGGNRRHQTSNIFAAFAVSTAWHCMGVPFLHQADYTALHFAPVVAWGTVNFLGVATHAAVRRRRPAQAYQQPLRLLVVAGKVALTLCFGALTVGLLNFMLGHTDRFVPFACGLVGLSGWCGAAGAS
ncbi:MAG: MBOAT family O-acyltransferase [Candidatus Binatia bacterium]